jgi:predicted Zn-dependent peptidase
MEEIAKELWADLQGRDESDQLEILASYLEDIYAQGLADGYDNSLSEEFDASEEDEEGELYELNDDPPLSDATDDE